MDIQIKCLKSNISGRLVLQMEILFHTDLARSCYVSSYIDENLTSACTIMTLSTVEASKLRSLIKETTPSAILILGGGSTTPEITSVLATTIKRNESAYYLEAANPSKKQKTNSEVAVPVEGNTAKNLSEELSAFLSRIKFLQILFMEGSWETSTHSLLSGDTTQDSGNSLISGALMISFRWLGVSSEE